MLFIGIRSFYFSKEAQSVSLHRICCSTGRAVSRYTFRHRALSRGFKNTIGKKELLEAERKKNHRCVAKISSIWLQKLFSIGGDPSDFMPIYPRSE